MKVALSHLTKRFPNRNKSIHTLVTAISDATFEIPDGKLIALLGPSGCGKSTMLNLISGLEKPTEGRIFFGSEDVTELPCEARGIGLVFQNYALYPHLTVRQNILFPLQNLRGRDKLTKADMEARMLDAAKLVQIETLLERKPNELSGGQQQRVAIARALVKTPRVLLLDEPLSNLDARLRIQTREEIRRIQLATGVTTVFVTHDQEEAMSIADLLVVMEKGHIREIGRPQDVYDDPHSLFVAKFLGTPPINVFRGSIKGQKLYIGDMAVLDADAPDHENVYVGVRPEGFITDENGAFACTLTSVEVMGRDISIVSTCEAMCGERVRAIVSAESAAAVRPGTVRFTLKKSKTLVFDGETEQRIAY